MRATVAGSCNGKGGKLFPAKGMKNRCRARRTKRRLKAVVYYYVALGDGVKMAFAAEDAIPGYDSRIPEPRKVSVTNVFVDGMLQSPDLYVVEPGVIRFFSDQPPPPQSRIIAQFIVIRDR